MAMFGFVYLWYLMFVLLLEIWFEYRHNLVVWWQIPKMVSSNCLYQVLSLFSTDISEKSRRLR